MKVTRRQLREMGIDLPNGGGKGPAPGGQGGFRRSTGRKPVKGVLTPAQTAFLALCEAHGLPKPVEEYRFAPPRKWRFDWVFDGWLAVEINGGVWVAGHHSRGQSQLDDWEKWNEGVCLGYSTLFFSPQQVESGQCFAVIKKALDSYLEQG